MDWSILGLESIRVIEGLKNAPLRTGYRRSISGDRGELNGHCPTPHTVNMLLFTLHNLSPLFLQSYGLRFTGMSDIR